MTVEAGRNLLHYRFVDKLGEGGMGVVWRAVDTTLDREVAIKLLPAEMAGHPDRLARFEREAKLLASLNHPNIAGIHGIHEVDGTPFLAMELVGGQDLQQRLAAGALSRRQTLEVALQIARALEAAHESGVIHRDLKPANVKLTDEGVVKVLDFGLAKALLDPSQTGASPSMSPTLTSAGTMAGMVLGTAAYMSPEQAKAKDVDRRADIWSFGVVLFEMLSGRRLFQGEGISETLAAVIMKDIEWGSLPGDTSPRIRRLLERCLERDPSKRLRDIGDARIAIEEVLQAPEDAAIAEPTAPRPSGLPWLVASVAVIAALASIAWLFVSRDTDSAAVQVIRMNVQLSTEDIVNRPGPQAVLSPDGTRIAYVAEPDSVLHVRMIDQLEGTALSGTSGAQQPFFSPDGRWIAFVAGRKLKKVAVVGGAPLTLCDVENFRGGSWGPDDTIVFAPQTSGGLLRVPASGGDPEELTLPGEGERSHRWPHFLPDGRALLFNVQERGTSFDEATVEILDLESKERRVLQRGGSNPAYVPTGHLVYVHEGTMFAVGFDLESRQVSGSAAPVLEGILFNKSHGGAGYHFSPAGHLLFSGGGARGNNVTLSWLAPDGARTPALAESRAYNQFSISPDGTKLAVDIVAESSRSDIWIHDFTRDTLTRLTFAEADNSNSRWSPDGVRIYFSSDRDGAANVYSKRADGTGEVVRLNESDIAHYVHDVSADGKTLLAATDDPDTGWDIVALEADGDHDSTDFLATPQNEYWPQMSPDGRWVAYGSSESGEVQIYVRPYPAGPGKWQISTDGAVGFPRWSTDGRELYYRRGDDLLVADVSGSGPSFVAQKPRVVLEDALGGVRWLSTWDLHPDGQRFLVTDSDESEIDDRTHAILVLNWFDELERRAPVLSGVQSP